VDIFVALDGVQIQLILWKVTNMIVDFGKLPPVLIIGRYNSKISLGMKLVRME
jgi:hypothetical protein